MIRVSNQELVALLLLLVANGTPILVRLALGKRLEQPLDGGWRFFDGRPLFGPSKTIVGLIAALSASISLSVALSIGWMTGLLIGGLAMLGDLLSSFVKRRMGLRSSAMALGLDQVPESLIPLMVCAPVLGLSWTQVLLVTSAFFVLEVILSRIAYHLGIRQQPY